MVFSSVTFVLVFLPLVLLGYMFLFLHTARYSLMWSNAFLLFASLLFYAWGEPKFVTILLISLFINFHVGLFVCPRTSPIKALESGRKYALVIGIILNIGLLCYFKYMNFFIDNGLLHIFKIILPASLNVTAITPIILPLGISFFTFQGLSYLVDVYRGEVQATRNIINFGCYLTMFPQLVAGPIVRYASIAVELYKRNVTAASFGQGVQRFITGLAKKILIADTLGRVADAAFDLPFTALSPLAAWIGIVCYTLQIYYDFSGYSDMAIGMGKMLGFTFPENFNYPYISRSIQEFWHRWHMTLSQWFRDYLYIPLGGNRKGNLRTVLNLWIVFALCGFWHGAAWVFLLWGLYHGSFLVLERLCPRFFSTLPSTLKHVYTIGVFMSGWVIFRAKDISHAGEYFQGLVGLGSLGVETNRLWLEFFAYDVYLALIIGIIGATPILPYIQKCWDASTVAQHKGIATCFECGRLTCSLALFCLCLMPLFGATYNAFIYFRF